MTQSIMESLFGDDPFFEDAYVLWPRRCSLTERFLRHREQMMESFRADIGDRLINELFQSLDELFSSPSSSTSSATSSATSSSTSSSTSTARLTGPSIFSLDTHGFSPDDIAVTVCGRKLEVKVAKPTEGDSSGPAGFSRSVELPEHINPSTLTCTLGDDGFLKIESQVKEAESDEREVPMRFRTSLDFPLSKDNTSKTEEKND
ncbi:heat shock protein beta-9 [Pangasianodon hypophthalmus]|uniref:heat shock protein beta-9 n=1 Tax=Pangasianodon hypophthalmus TaxID=310915 RepID=UPI00230795F0|nr:heat shock protein beta-9 [Pangasianodon hypophthalmus]